MASDETQQTPAESAIVYSGKTLDGGVIPCRTGRPKGVPNKTTQEVKAAARNLVDDPDYRESLRKRLHAGLAPHMETLLWHYAYGKPTERIEVKDTTNDFDGITAEQLRLRAAVIAQRVKEDDQQSAVH